MCIELIFLAINYEFLLHSTAFAEIHGQVMSILILTVTAAETACALALLVAYFLSEFELAVSYQRIVKHRSCFDRHCVAMMVRRQIANSMRGRFDPFAGNNALLLTSHDRVYHYCKHLYRQADSEWQAASHMIIYSIILANGLLALLYSWSMFEYSRRFSCHFSCLLS